MWIVLTQYGEHLDQLRGVNIPVTILIECLKGLSQLLLQEPMPVSVILQNLTENTITKVIDYDVTQV